jgi:hypothetical protein
MSATVETTRCPKCSATLPAATRFCRSCGAAVATTPLTPASAPTAARSSAEPQWVRQWQRAVAKAMSWWRTASRYLLADHSQQWWDVVAMLGGGTLGTFWMIYSRIRHAQEGWQTAVLIFLMPVGMTFARKQLDKLLKPLQQVRKTIPQWALITMGLLAPFGIATILLQIGVRLLGISDERCIQAAMLIGTSVAYAILRTPDDTERPKGPQATAPSGRRL